jgi:hypothetical protein
MFHFLTNAAKLPACSVRDRLRVIEGKYPGTAILGELAFSRHFLSSPVDNHPK